ncbi:pyridoxamine 5'-phosphate oxidase family protein [Catenulispora subtropica]|uniref:Pyridoxamine 5'-phosphate oxidase family protein n=2 Tax=Catenulispora subtropica TaxID=450798 RepID=A0ABN2R899_9ACTN
MAELDRDEALALLGSVNMGRIVFTRNALPAIRPVNHALVDGHLVIRTHESAALTHAVDGSGTVVAYEADMIDQETHLGWSVVVTGFARLVTDPDQLARYEKLVAPWVGRAMEHAVLIRLDMVNGFRMTDADEGRSKRTAKPEEGRAPGRRVGAD